MLYLIPAPLHRALMPLAHRVRTAWLRIAKPTVYGVSVAAFDADDRLLLVRHSYGPDKWSMPAGGMRRSENPEATIRREVTEELGVALDNLRLVSQHEEELHGITNHVWVYSGRVLAEPKPDMREVIAAQFFNLADLPERLEKRVRPRLDMLQKLEQR